MQFAIHREEKKNFCDLKITFTEKKKDEQFSIVKKIIFIENKVRESLNDEQLKEQIKGINNYLRHYLPVDSKSYLIFLTPPGPKYKEVIKHAPSTQNIITKHFNWNKDENSKTICVVDLLLQTKNEATVEAKKLISDFIEFVEEGFRAHNFKKNAEAGKKNEVPPEEFEYFINKICETRTLEILKALEKKIDTVLSKKESFKKCYISSNRSGIISYIKFEK